MLLTQMTVMLSASLVYVDYFPLLQMYYASIYKCRKCDLFFCKRVCNLIITGLVVVVVVICGQNYTNQCNFDYIHQLSNLLKCNIIAKI